jgi:hypothetical protein
MSRVSPNIANMLYKTFFNFAHRLRRSHDKLRQSDSHVGKLLTDSYMKRNKAVQEAVQRKINADKMRLFNNKCINSINKGFPFWIITIDRFIV